MVRERKTEQTTVKMSVSMKKDRDNAAETLGISYMEYIRQDCREKLDRESENGKVPDNLKDAVLEVLDEIGIKYNINK